MSEKAGPEERFTGSRADLRFGSNAVKLSPREWLIAALLFLVYFLLAPCLWERMETFHPSEDYRIPYDLSNDYWIFSRYARIAADRGATLVVGDSVIWGQYVTTNQTLTHYLNELAGRQRFANLGVDGMHPVALAGLLRHHAGSLSGQNVILHCNLLWTGSEKHDLQTEKTFFFNHPLLVPQLYPNIPCYGESYSKRLGIAIERNVPFYAWTAHVRSEYLDRMDLAAWTLEHPRAIPPGLAHLDIPQPDSRLLHEPIPWYRGGMPRQDFAWVKLETSLQWRFFQEAVRILQRRGNRLFLLVGPFNEHLLTDKSQAVYATRKSAVQAWLEREGIPCFVPAPLPSERYGDASHPLSEGYSHLARLLLADAAFTVFNNSCRRNLESGQKEDE
jgi:hypothetical protein